MAIVQVPEFYEPAPIVWQEGLVPGFFSNPLATGGRKFAFILRVPKGGTLETFEFNIGTVTQNPTNGLKVSFQDVVNGEPNGTATYYYYIPTGSIAANTWIIPPYITSDGADTGSRKTVTHRDFVACVIEFTNFVLGDSLIIRNLTHGVYAIRGAYGVVFNTAGSAWAKSEGGFPVMALMYDDGNYVSLADAYAIYEFITTPIFADEEIDEIGLAFQLTAPKRVGGAYVLVDPEEDFDIVLYDTEANEELERVRVEVGSYTPNVFNIDYVMVRFTHDHLIKANQFYVLSVAPTGTTGIVNVYSVLANSAAQMAGMPCGVNWHYRDRVDGGDWRELTNHVPLFGLLVTGIDHDISGGSGGGGWEGNP